MQQHRRHDTQHKDIQHNDTQHKRLIYDAWHNNTIIMLSVTLFVVMLNVAMRVGATTEANLIKNDRPKTGGLGAYSQNFLKYVLTKSLKIIRYKFRKNFICLIL
jgi:hypothetical protein